jgi:hypothetical protein
MLCWVRTVYPGDHHFRAGTGRSILCRWMCGLLGTVNCHNLVVRRMYTCSGGPGDWRNSGTGSSPPRYPRGDDPLPPAGLHHAFFSGPPSIHNQQVQAYQEIMRWLLSLSFWSVAARIWNPWTWQSPCLRRLRHEPSSPAWKLGSLVRIPLEAWMTVCVYSVCR